MRSSTKDKIKGEKNRFKGSLKESIGKFTGNRDMEQEGKDDKFLGKLRKKIGEIKKVFNH